MPKPSAIKPSSFRPFLTAPTLPSPISPSPVDLLQKDSTPYGKVLGAAEIAALSTNECHRLARDPETPVPTLLALRGAGQASLKTVLCTHPRIPGKVLERWANTDEVSVRKALLRNPRLPSDALWLMVVRSRQLTTPPSRRDGEVSREERKELSNTRRIETEIRTAILQHPNVNSGVLAELSRDANVLVRLEALNHPVTPRVALRSAIEHSRRSLAAQDRPQWKYGGVTAQDLIDAATANLNAREV